MPFCRPSIEEADIAAVTDVLRSGWLTTGSICRAFEDDLASYVGTNYAIAVASCTHALEICVAHLGLPRGARVGVPDWTFISTALSVVHNNLAPVLLDVDADTLNLSAASVDAAICDGLDAVIGVHFGGGAFSEQIHELCRKANIPLIEDAAHALGARDAAGRVNGSRSSGACFSFYATKNLTSAEGGAITTNDPELADFARTYRQHGMTAEAWKRYRPDGGPLYDLTGPGIKANLADVLAALARSQLRRFDRLQTQRRRLVERYRCQLGHLPGIQVVPQPQDVDSADHLLVIILPEGTSRGEVISAMADAGIGTSIHFQPLHAFPWVHDNIEIGPTGTPVATSLAGRVLSLPLFPDLAAEQVDRICDELAGALQLTGP